MRRRVVWIAGFAVLVLLAAGCTPYITPTGPAPLRYRDDVFTNVTKTTNITYGSALTQQGATQTLLLDTYEPTGDTVTKRPAIVWVHGGGFVSGNKSSPELQIEANAFAKKGYFNISIDYRLAPTGCSFGNITIACVRGIADAQHDAQAAVRWLRKNASTLRVDPDRIGIGGSSAGAITALDVAYNSENPGDSGNPGFPSDVGAAVSLSGSLIFGAVQATDPPSLLFHGTADPVVPFSQATATINRIHSGGARAYLTAFDGAGHVPFVPFEQVILDQTRNFLYHELDLAHAEQ